MFYCRDDREKFAKDISERIHSEMETVNDVKEASPGDDQEEGPLEAPYDKACLYLAKHNVLELFQVYGVNVCLSWWTTIYYCIFKYRTLTDFPNKIMLEICIIFARLP